LDDDPQQSQRGGREELVDLANIEMIHKKRKHDKESRFVNYRIEIMVSRSLVGLF
jgi:hypothetical protein